MKAKIVSMVAASGLLAAAAWFVQAPSDAQAVALPVEYREMIRKGLDYLAGKQFADGHWEAEDGAQPVAMTGLAGLALLMEGDGDSLLSLEDRIVGTANKENHAANVRKAADWLMGQSRPGRDGLIFSDHPSESSRYMQGHGLATLFLAGVRPWESPQEARRRTRPGGEIHSERSVEPGGLVRHLEGRGARFRDDRINRLPDSSPGGG
jgi:hypothetical protein